MRCTCGELAGVNPDLCDHAVARDMRQGPVLRRQAVRLRGVWFADGKVQRIEFTANHSRVLYRLTIRRDD
jgi:hypothetical protein